MMNTFLVAAAFVAAALVLAKPKWLQNLGAVLHAFADTYNTQYTEDEDSGVAVEKAD
jgi:hypothetical protein